MNKIRIIIFVDSRYRDTLACILVKKEIEKRLDANVLLISVDLWEQAMSMFNPHVVVLNHVIGYRNRRIAAMSDVAIVLPTEGRPNSNEQLQWYVSEQDGLSDLFLSWNSPVAKKFNKTEAVVVGAPRFDVYHTHTYLIDSREKVRAKLRLAQERPVIGVLTSFPQARYAHRSVAFNEHDWNDLGITKIKNRENPTEFAQRELLARQRFLTAIANYSYEHSEYQFLIKPHPMEDVLSTMAFADRHGMSVVTQETVYNVISACDVVVNRKGCLTTADAWLMGKGVVSLGEYEDEGMAVNETAPSTLSEIPATIANPSKYIDKNYLKKIGVSTPAAASAASEIVRKIKKARLTKREYSIINMAALAKLMTLHSRQNGVPVVEDGAVGKAAISAYIRGIEQRV